MILKVDIPSELLLVPVAPIVRVLSLYLYWKNFILQLYSCNVVTFLILPFQDGIIIYKQEHLLSPQTPAKNNNPRIIGRFFVSPCEISILTSDNISCLFDKSLL